MFTKVLVAEDFDSYSIAVSEALKSLDIIDISHSAYCDDALLKVRKSIADHNQFDLLITDLSFKPDSKPAVISNGLELIKHVCDLQPHIKVIVYSIENRQHLVQQLFHELSIDGFVLKGRNNIPEIKKAVTAAYEGKRYISPDVSHFLTD
ncbi:MAG: response regulator transcription factor, partial [Proteobacteria bacterium]